MHLMHDGETWRELGPTDGIGNGDELVVLYEDDALLAVAKPAGLVTHPAYRHPDGTLCDLVFARQARRSESRPWLLHRLDRETSGVVLFAKTEQARRALVRQFERRTVQKQYLAICVGQPSPASGEIAAPLARDPADRRRTVVDAAGQPALTRYQTLCSTADGAYSLVLAGPHTGRTHQIRAHLTSQGAPLVGDSRYLPAGHPAASLASRAMLHAWRIAFKYPGSGMPVQIVAPLPDDFTSLLCQLRLDAGLTSAARFP